MKTAISNILAGVYPRQTEYLRYLLDSGKIHHAYSIVGSSEGGQYSIADQFAGGIVCDQPTRRTQNSFSCGLCHSCTQYSARIHPDVLIIRPENGELLTVKSAVEIRRFLSSSAVLSNRKVVILHDADRLNHPAANALLKVIEEPTVTCTIILTVGSNGSLLPTIQSRVQNIRLPQLSRESAEDILRAGDITDDSTEKQQEQYGFWLRFFCGTNSERQKLLQEHVVQSTDTTNDQSMEYLFSQLQTIESLLHDLLGISCGVVSASTESNSDTTRLRECAGKNSPLFFTTRLRLIEEIKKMVRAHGNKKMIFEYLTIHL